MSFQAIWTQSIIGQSARGLAAAIDNSALVNWYRGSDNFNELRGFRNSSVYKIFAPIGRGLAWGIDGIGRIARRLIQPSATFSVLDRLYSAFPNRPIRLLSIMGLSMLIVNTAILLSQNPHASLRSLLLRGGAAVILAVGVTVETSWEQFADSSLIVRLLRDLLWGY